MESKTTHSQLDIWLTIIRTVFTPLSMFYVWQKKIITKKNIFLLSFPGFAQTALEIELQFLETPVQSWRVGNPCLLLTPDQDDWAFTLLFNAPDKHGGPAHAPCCKLPPIKMAATNQGFWPGSASQLIFYSCQDGATDLLFGISALPTVFMKPLCPLHWLYSSPHSHWLHYSAALNCLLPAPCSSSQSACSSHSRALRLRWELLQFG